MGYFGVECGNVLGLGGALFAAVVGASAIAKEERELFKLLFMCDRGGKGLTPTADFEASVQMIMSANEVTREEAQLIHLEMWSAVHGIATMQATSFVELDGELISAMLSDIYQGVRARYQK